MRIFIALVTIVIVAASLFITVKHAAPQLAVRQASPPAAPADIALNVASERVVRHAAAGGAAAWSPQIARTGKLSLFVDDPQKAANAVAAIAHRFGGQVFSLELSSAGGSAPSSAAMEIRVPADRYESTVAAVTAIGKVRERSESAQDLTGDLSDSGARLENLERTENDMRKIMDRSGSVEQILDVENQVSQVREQIQTLETQLKTMRGQVTYSTIDIALQTEAGAVPVEAAPASQLAAAWQHAVHALVQTTVGLASFAVWLAVFAPYALLVAAIGAVAFRRWVRA